MKGCLGILADEVVVDFRAFTFGNGRSEIGRYLYSISPAIFVLLSVRILFFKRVFEKTIRETIIFNKVFLPRKLRNERKFSKDSYFTVFVFFVPFVVEKSFSLWLRLCCSRRSVGEK